VKWGCKLCRMSGVHAAVLPNDKGSALYLLTGKSDQNLVLRRKHIAVVY
jgi:hypothetical protein